MSSEKTENAALLIIGGGASGLSVAVEAVEKGIKDIVVVEKQRGVGGMGRFAQGFFACESPVQYREMFDVTVEHCFRNHMEWAHWFRVDPKVVLAFLRKSGETICWLEEKGFKFRLKKTWPNQLPVWHVPEGGGKKYLETVKQICDDHGVRFVTQSAAKKILVDGSGRAYGALIETPDGMIEYHAKCTVIATGGIGGAPALMKKYCPAYDEEVPIDGTNKFNTGDGLLMAEEIGAGIAKTLPMLCGGHWPDSNMAPGSMVLTPVTTDPVPMWVDSSGRRFTDESYFYADFAALNLTHKLTYTIFDESIREKLENEGPSFSEAPGHNPLQKGNPGIKELFGKPGSEKYCIKANTIEELATWIGASSETLKETVEEYNASCHTGYDQQFFKDRRYLLPLAKAPFYAVRCRVVFHDTCGGIRVTEKMKVKDTEDRIIPGLYATGSLSDGLEPDVYNWRLCSFAFGFAINSGRIAADAIALELLDS